MNPGAVPDPAAVDRARARLLDLLPGLFVIDAPVVPAVGRVPGLTLAVDVLQPGGSAWVRGALHALLERFADDASKPPVVVHGKPRWILSWGHGALLAGHEFEVHLSQDHPLDGLWNERVNALSGVRVIEHENDDALQSAVRARAEDGAFVATDVEDPPVFAGLATLGAELGDRIRGRFDDSAPTKVLVGPGRLCEAVRHGLDVVRGNSSPVPVEPVHRGHFDEQERRALQAQLRVHLRLDAGPGAAAAFGLGLEVALAGHRVVVVLGG